MLQAVLAGALAGYAIAIPVGAIAVLIIHTAMTDGLRHGLAAGAGAATADLIYATVAVVGGLAVSDAIGPWIGPLRIVGGALLVAIGVRGLLILRSSRDAAPGRVLAGQRAHGRTYLTVLGLTLLNPATVISFAALAVGLPFLGGIGERLAFSVAAFAASLSWQSTLAAFGALLGRRTSHSLRRLTVLAGNAVVIGLGALIVIEGIG
jgi:threonine/homoserine/homoserine lactone efflux protein